MNKTFKDVLTKHITLCVHEITIPLYMVSKTCGKITVCKHPRCKDVRPFKEFPCDYKIYINGYVFNVDKKNINGSKLERFVEYGTWYQCKKRLTHYLFVDKEEAKEYARSIVNKNINELNLQLIEIDNL